MILTEEDWKEIDKNHTNWYSSYYRQYKYCPNDIESFIDIKKLVNEHLKKKYEKGEIMNG